MKKIVAVLAFALGTIFLAAGSAAAVSFGSFDLGLEITVNDGIANSTYSGGSPAKGVAGEDDETEMQFPLLTYTDQQWDLEGMFWNPEESILSIVGGFDFLNGVGGESIGDLFIGDGCALDFQRDGTNLLEVGLYNIENAPFGTVEPDDIKASSPYQVNGSGVFDPGDGVYRVFRGITVGTYFSDWPGTDAVLENGSVHHMLQIYASDTIADLINSGESLHLTMSCGNDTIHGAAAPVPEPATILLLGTGLLGTGLFTRRRKR